MDYTFTPIKDEYRETIIDIFNHYVENSYAAYSETKLPYEAFYNFAQMFQGFPNAAVKDSNGKLIGFGFLRTYNPLPTFSHTAEISYFLSPIHTGKGIGRALLDYLIEEGKRKGITHILANISSLNIESITFHKKNGFFECGRFKNICKKNQRYFDVIWMQRNL